MILSTLVTSQLHFEMCAGLYGHPVYACRLAVILHPRLTYITFLAYFDNSINFSKKKRSSNKTVVA